MTEVVGPRTRYPVPMEFTVFLEETISPKVSQLIAAIFTSAPTQKLAEITENNPWHDNENALDHVQTVFANLQRLLKFEFIEDLDIQAQYKAYFAQSAAPGGALNRAEALLVACSLHDISKGQPRPENDEFAGKPYVFFKEDGNTTGKGHEHASAEMVPELLGGSGLFQADIDHIQYLVEQHGQFSLDFVQNELQGYESGDMQADITTILQVQPNYAVELMLHIIADEWGAEISQWKSEYLLKLIRNNFIPQERKT